MYSCGLVLEGGGNRAIYTSGVLDAFMDQGITFPYVIGVSAGSCNAVSYIGKCRGRQHDISIQYSGDKRFMSLENMIKNGEFLNGEWLFGELSYDLSPLDQEAYDRANTTLFRAAERRQVSQIYIATAVFPIFIHHLFALLSSSYVRGAETAPACLLCRSHICPRHPWETEYCLGNHQTVSC